MIELLNIIALMCGMNAICHKYYMNCMQNWTPHELVQCTKESTNFGAEIYIDKTDKRTRYCKTNCEHQACDFKGR